MESNLSEFEHESPSRSTLLTVLCILTFIGSGWAILSNTWAYITAPQFAKVISYKTNGTMPDSLSSKDSALYRTGKKKHSAFGEKMMVSLSKMLTEDNIRKNAIAAIISAILTLIGAILMWRLQRYGFYIYIAGIIMGLIAPFYLYGNNLLAIGISSFTSFFGLVFIALYALNFKSLKK